MSEIQLTPAQQEFLDLDSQYRVGLGPSQIGKTTALARLGTWKWARRDRATLWVTPVYSHARFRGCPPGLFQVVDWTWLSVSGPHHLPKFDSILFDGIPPHYNWAKAMERVLARARVAMVGTPSISEERATVRSMLDWGADRVTFEPEEATHITPEMKEMLARNRRDWNFV